MADFIPGKRQNLEGQRVNVRCGRENRLLQNPIGNQDESLWKFSKFANCGIKDAYSQQKKKRNSIGEKKKPYSIEMPTMNTFLLIENMSGNTQWVVSSKIPQNPINISIFQGGIRSHKTFFWDFIHCSMTQKIWDIISLHPCVYPHFHIPSLYNQTPPTPISRIGYHVPLFSCIIIICKCTQITCWGWLLNGWWHSASLCRLKLVLGSCLTWVCAEAWVLLGLGNSGLMWYRPGVGSIRVE